MKGEIVDAARQGYSMPPNWQVKNGTNLINDTKPQHAVV
jgi:hypothetical protein